MSEIRTRQLFGTDGVRGRSNTPPMDAATALSLGQAVGRIYSRGGHRHRVVIGKDTRLSGYMIESALTAGFLGAGIDVMIVGPLPTPAIPFLVRTMRCDLGVMISASHNAYEDNGIKLFGPDGLKLSDAQETEIEHLMAGGLVALASPGRIGRSTRIEDAKGRYMEAAKSAFPKGVTLAGLRIVLDCANGAAYRVAPQVLWELGADVVLLGVTPDGTNINRECGSTSPGHLAEIVRERRADIGIALDGDADRMLLVDEEGEIIDGDQVMSLIAETWHAEGRLRGKGIVATVMSNLGLERHLSSVGLTLHRTKVGDRYVGEKMREIGCNIGGEQSGHIILGDFGPTGDGLVAALQVLAALIQTGRKASEVCHRFDPLPQRLVNVRHAPGVKPLENPAVLEIVDRAVRSIGTRGRVLVRASGTEPLIRVMAEGENEAEINNLVDALASDIDGIASSSR
jgi:phosphoglucosamine mutase